MIDWNSVRLPIVIFSTARSGSSALANHIHRKVNDVMLFEEPEHDEESLSKFLQAAQESKQYIVKIHSDGFEKYPNWISEYLIQSEEPYKICIRRRNKLEQCVSLYIELDRHKWSYKADSPLVEDTIVIDERKIKGAIFWINRQTTLLDRLNVNFDLTVWYEDFEFDVPEFIKTPKPKNYEEVYHAVSKMYSTLNI